MTVNEAAKNIGISPSKLYQLIAARRIAHYRVGGKIIIGEADVAAYLQACRVGVSEVSVSPVPPPRHHAPRLRHIQLNNDKGQPAARRTCSERYPGA